MTLVNTYLTFRHQAADAMAFYQSVFGGDLTRTTYEEFGMADDPADAGKTMHAQLTTTEGWVLMASDLPAGVEASAASTVSVSVSGGPDESEKLHGWFDLLADGGEVRQPLLEAPWGDSFGSFVDRFGTSWMVNIGGAPAP